MGASSRLRGALAAVADHVAPLAVLAAVLGVLVPSPAAARRSDLLLAALVLLTALAIPPARLRSLRRRAGVLLMLSVGPFAVLTAVAWALGRGFDEPVRDGVLALGLSSSEVASVGLVALAGGDAALALGVLTGSLVVAAVLGPVLASGLGDAAGHASASTLLVRFALVVLVPLAVGVAARAARPTLARAEDVLGGLSALAVCALVYAALGGVPGGAHLAAAALAGLLFLVAGTLLALIAARLTHRLDAPAVALPVALRDFAVAAALATQAFGTRAAAVAGIYGVLMLTAGAITATRLRRRSSSAC